MLEVLYHELSKKFEIKRKMLSMEDDRETTYLNRTLKVSEVGVEIIGDKKHSDILLREWGLQGLSKEVSTPSLKELEDNNNVGEGLHGEMATKVCRGSRGSITWPKIVRTFRLPPRPCRSTCHNPGRVS